MRRWRRRQSQNIFAAIKQLSSRDFSLSVFLAEDWLRIDREAAIVA
jgi:hypothetical protein